MMTLRNSNAGPVTIFQYNTVLATTNSANPGYLDQVTPANSVYFTDNGTQLMVRVKHSDGSTVTGYINIS
jgi:hypothetical protein